MIYCDFLSNFVCLGVYYSGIKWEIVVSSGYTVIWCIYIYIIQLIWSFLYGYFRSFTL